MLRDTDAATAAESRTRVGANTNQVSSGSPTQAPSGARKRAIPLTTPPNWSPASEPIAVSEQAQHESGAINAEIPRGASPRSQPIPPGESQADAQSANFAPKPSTPASAAQPISPTERKARKRGATIFTKPTRCLPPASPIGGNADGDGHSAHDTHGCLAIAATIRELVMLQRKRRFCIVSQSRIDRSIESLIASMIGFRVDATEEDRKAVFAQAKTIRLAVEKGDGQPSGNIQTLPAVTFLAPMILTSAATRVQWDSLRDDTEKQMRKIAKTLSVYPWAQKVKGFGDLALGIIVAEAGIPIGEYRTVSGLWKRMGLAVIDGERQRRKTSKEDAARHGYSPMRRAEVWSLCSDSMFRHQWRAAKEDAPAGPAGPYGEVYARRKANTVSRIDDTADLPKNDPDKWTKGRVHNDARRIMTKELLKDLWVEWRKSSPA
jgi:hypothetical protein